MLIFPHTWCAMCGRYLLAEDAELLAAQFNLEVTPRGLRPRYNVAPSQPVPAVGAKAGGGKFGLVEMRWGFVPRFAKSPTDGPRPINARSETAATSLAFRASFAARRCLLPASGFYEWRRDGKLKIPYCFRPRDGEPPLAFAALWDRWAGVDGEPLYSVAILTTSANGVMRPFHDRMPCLIPPEHYGAWLDPEASRGVLAGLLAPADDDWLAVTAASPLVNSAKSEGPECVAGPAA